MSGTEDDPNPDHYDTEPFFSTEKKQVGRYGRCCLHEFQIFWSQDSTPVLWLAQPWQNLIDNGVYPDHAVRFLRNQHLGVKTADRMARWMAATQQITKVGKVPPRPI